MKAMLPRHSADVLSSVKLPWAECRGDIAFFDLAHA